MILRVPEPALSNHRLLSVMAVRRYGDTPTRRYAIPFPKPFPFPDECILMAFFLVLPGYPAFVS